MVFCLTVAAFPRYSWPATVAIWALALAAVGLAWGGPDRRSARPTTSGALVWGGVAIAAGGWELAALAQQPTLLEGSPDHPTLSVLLDPVLATYPGRVAVLACWLALGRYLVRKAMRP